MSLSELQIEHLKEWIGALRSGEYEQYRTWMRNEDRFCCLGVAMDICKIGYWDGNNNYHVNAPFSQHPIIDVFQDYYGISKSICEILVDKNDFKNENFNQIADYIETEILCQN